MEYETEIERAQGLFTVLVEYQADLGHPGNPYGCNDTCEQPEGVTVEITKVIPIKLDGYALGNNWCKRYWEEKFTITHEEQASLEESIAEHVAQEHPDESI